MTGLIWLVQLVQYPLFKDVGAQNFANYHALHSQRITWIVAPVMGVQLISAIWGTYLEFQPNENTSHLLSPSTATLCLLLSIGVFGVTALASVPMHRILAGGFDLHAYQRLVSTNWLRTAIWTLHALIGFFFVSQLARVAMMRAS